jgi:repressor LexA
LGISIGSITKWKNGAVPRETTLLKIADHFGVTVDYLLGKEKAPDIKSNAIILDPAKTRMVPVYESVSAGFGTLAQDLILEYMPIYIPSESEAAETICIKVTGDSMSPEIENGDIIQVYKTSSVDSGSIAVVLVDGDDALVKKIIYDDIQVELHSLNPKYPPVAFRGIELMRVRILGVVKNTLKNPKNTHFIPAEPQLSKDELELVKLFRQIPKDQRKIYLERGRAYADSLKQD